MLHELLDRSLVDTLTDGSGGTRRTHTNAAPGHRPRRTHPPTPTPRRPGRGLRHNVAGLLLDDEASSDTSLGRRKDGKASGRPLSCLLFLFSLFSVSLRTFRVRRTGPANATCVCSGKANNAASEAALRSGRLGRIGWTCCARGRGGWELLASGALGRGRLKASCPSILSLSLSLTHTLSLSLSLEREEATPTGPSRTGTRLSSPWRDVADKDSSLPGESLYFTPLPVDE
jgi:hypothetical protein